MNETTPPPGTPGEPGGSGNIPPAAQRPSGDGFFAWLRGLGIIRSDERWFTGVAGGIAAKANIDPLIVRGVFVVLALLGGPGLLLYLAGWLLLPDSRGRIQVEELIRGRAQTGVVIAAIAIAALVILPIVIPALTFWQWDIWSVFGVPAWVTITFSWLFWIAVLIGLGFLVRHAVLQHGRAQHSQGPTTPSPGAEPAGAEPAAPFTKPTTSSEGASPDWGQRAEAHANDWGARANEWGERAGERANAWGERVGKQADDWSARYAEHHEQHKLGAGHTILTLAIALLAAGTAAFWATSTGLTGFSPIPGDVSGAFLAAALAFTSVLAFSLIVAGVRGRHTGWIGFLSACSVVLLLFTAILPWGSRFQPFGEMHIDAGTKGAAMLAGNTYVDLRDLDQGHASHDLVIWHLFGNATVVLPETAPAEVRVRVLAGNITERPEDGAGRRTSGPFLQRTFTANTPATLRNQATSTVTVYLLAGQVRVVRADALSDSDDDLFPDTYRSELREDVADLEGELLELQWELQEPGITAGQKKILQDRLAQTQKELDGMKAELAR